MERAFEKLRSKELDHLIVVAVFISESPKIFGPQLAKKISNRRDELHLCGDTWNHAGAISENHFIKEVPELVPFGFAQFSRVARFWRLHQVVPSREDVFKHAAGFSWIACESAF